MPTPTISLRIPAEHQPLIRRLAAAIKDRPEVIPALEAVLQAEPQPVPQAAPALADLSERVEAIARKLDHVDEAERLGAKNAHEGIMAVWDYIDKMVKRIAEAEARLTAIEAAAAPAEAAAQPVGQPELQANPAPAPRRRRQPK